ncbi:restriction endonuclease subunit S [Pseudanabaena cinerea]|uniref:restriction endonuclease subunit S n=1 Tax=Pseudanabaena cinerea TaxID=2661616 RepID=UPI00389AA0FE
MDPQFLKYCLDSIFTNGIEHIVFGAAYKALTIEKLKQFKIPLPPIAIQKEIVTEIEGYQKEITNYELRIKECRQKIDKTIDKVWCSDEI